MAPLIFLLGTLALLGAFALLMSWEAARGTRFFAGTRYTLDTKVEHLRFIYEHVDFNAFVAEETKALMLRLGHFVAYLSLQSVRAVERLLTRTVRHLRTKVTTDGGVPRATERPFVQALGEFKEELKATRPPMPEL